MQASSNTQLMMNCEASRILISAYLDGELSDQETQMLKVHLQTCETCVHYLHQQEILNNALKHYTLFQESPRVPSGFAKKVTAKLQEELPQKRLVVDQISWTYQKFVFGFVERWAKSLKASPFIWTAAVSCMVVLTIGLVSFQVVQQASWQEQAKVVLIGTESTSEPSDSSPESDISDSRKQLALREEMPAASERAPQIAARAPESKAVTEQEQEEETGEVVEVDELIVEEDGTPFIRVASNHAASVEDYVYSHVVEVYQTHFVDDALFVGYVQDAFTQ